MKADYTDNYSFDRLLKIFFRYTQIKRDLILTIPGITDENVDAFMQEFNLLFLSDDQLAAIEGIVSNVMNPETFSHTVPDDEEEYIWHIGRVILKRCHDEVIRRNISNMTKVRTNNN